MNSANIENTAVRPKGVVKAKLSRDDIIMRGGMIVIALYLVISLVFPLYSMFSKSFSTFQYDLSKFEVQVSDDTGQFPPTIVSLESLNGELEAISNDELSTGSGGRLGVTMFFLTSVFVVQLCIVLGMWIIREGFGRFDIGNWNRLAKLDSNTFRRVQLRPVRSTGLSNFINYFSTPALFKSIQNSIFISVISTIITVILAFWFAYALNRSCMRFKGFSDLLLWLQYWFHRFFQA